MPQTPREPVGRTRITTETLAALRALDGSTASVVSLLTGLNRDEIDRLGGFAD